MQPPSDMPSSAEVSTPGLPAAAPSATPAQLGWRLLAITYDVLPALALWFVACYAIELTHKAQPMASLKPDLLTGYFELLLLWLIPGIYMVISWRRGGHSLGMRAWRLKVLAVDGRPASWRALCIRYVVATVSLLIVGLGFLWSLIDSERRTWHDIASGTRFVRMDRAD